MYLLQWWGGLSPWIRYGVALILILISTGIFYFTRRIWVWGWALGTAMLLFAGPSDVEKRGYRF